MSETVDIQVNTTPVVTLPFITNTEVQFNAHLFEGVGDSWSLKRLQKPSDGRNPLGNALSDAMVTTSAADMFLPSPVDFNARLIHPEDLCVTIPLSAGRYRNAHRNPSKPADITWLEKCGDAYAFSGGGCALFVIECAGFLFVGHAGRDSVLDRVRVETMGREKGRRVEGVVETVFTCLQPNPKQLAQAQVWVFWSIPPTAFAHEHSHKTFGEYNRSLYAYVNKRVGDIDPHCVRVINDASYPDITRIFRAQCIKFGVRDENIHTQNGYLVANMPHTRKNPNGRYLAAIVRRN